MYHALGWEGGETPAKTTAKGGVMAGKRKKERETGGDGAGVEDGVAAGGDGSPVKTKRARVMKGEAKGKKKGVKSEEMVGDDEEGREGVVKEEDIEPEV